MTEYNQMMAVLGSALASGQPMDIEGYVERAVFGGASSELADHLRRTKRTVGEEYELIQQKKSSLSRRMRGYVEYLHSKMQEAKEKGEGEV